MKQEIILRILLERPPGGVDFAIQKGKGSTYETIQNQRSGTENITFEFPVMAGFKKDGSLDFHGAVVQGVPGGRFVYINIGSYAGASHSVWNRRLKIPLEGVDPALISEVLLKQERIIETTVPGTGKDGGPNCGTVKPFAGWHRVQ